MTIFYPYPQHANMEVEEDVERVARWLGSIVKPAHLNAFYHKPSVSTTFRLLYTTFSPLARSSPIVAYTYARKGVCSVLAPMYADRRRCAAFEGFIERIRY